MGAELSHDIDNLERARRQYPHLERLDWRRVFDADISVLGAIIHDIVKADAAEGTPGRRPQLRYDATSALRLRQIMGEDHTTLPFHEIFTILRGNMALATLAHKTGISKTQCWRLLQGQAEPTADEMERVAAAYRRHPSFFAEWRRGWVMQFLERCLVDQPEATIGFYRRLSSR